MGTIQIKKYDCSPLTAIRSDRRSVYRQSHNESMIVGQENKLSTEMLSDHDFLSLLALRASIGRAHNIETRQRRFATQLATLEVVPFCRL